MVKVYTTPTCAYCVTVKRYLDYKGVDYQVVDALEDPDYPVLAEQYGFTVPLIINGDKGTTGFNIPRLNEIL